MQKKAVTKRKAAPARPAVKAEPVRMLMTQPLGGERMSREQVADALRGRLDSPVVRAVVQLLEEKQQGAQDLAQQPRTVKEGMSAYYNGAAAWTFDALWEIVALVQGRSTDGG